MFTKSKVMTLKESQCVVILGSFATASCTVCGHKVTADDIRPDIFLQKIPQCPVCPANSGEFIFCSIVENKKLYYSYITVLIIYS